MVQIRGLTFTKFKAEGPGRGWWGPPKGDHVSRGDLYQMSDIGRFEYQQGAKEISYLSSSESKRYLDTLSSPIGGMSEKERASRLYACAFYMHDPDSRLKASKILEKVSFTEYNDWERKSMESSLDKGYEAFGKRVSSNWASDERGVWTAQIHNAARAIAPGEIGELKSFFREGIKPPIPNPKMISYMDKMYNTSQQHLPKEVLLHRGIAGKITYRAPLESWTSDKAIATRFAKHYAKSRGLKPQVSSALIPKEYIFASFRTLPGWREETVKGKEEYIVFGSFPLG